MHQYNFFFQKALDQVVSQAPAPLPQALPLPARPAAEPPVVAVPVVEDEEEDEDAKKKRRKGMHLIVI